MHKFVKSSIDFMAQIQKMKSKQMKATPPLPTDKAISAISTTLNKKYQKEEKERTYAPVKEVLMLLGKGVLLSAAFIVPGSTILLKNFNKESMDWESWKHYNPSYLRRTLQRLEQNKHVEIIEQNGEQVVALTKNGKRKILKYSMEKLEIEKPKHWDGKWRLVLYDIPVHDKSQGDVVRQALRMLGFYMIQKSVYIYPYPCFDQIEFMREFYGLGDIIQYMLVTKIERDDAYKTYFNLT